MFEARDVGRWLILASWVGVGSLGALACDGGGSTAGDDRGAALLASEAIEPGATCSAGGQRVRAGLDRNGDAELQEDEVTQEIVLCNGEEGPQGSSGEPGQDGGEGDPGAKGEAGTSSLLQLTEVPPGSPCCSGGVRLEVGLDANADGVLDPEEVDPAQTQHVCNGTPDGVAQCRHLFFTSGPHRGDGLGAIAEADRLCNEDANKPNDSQYKALLVHGTDRVACTTAGCSGGVSEHVDWVLAPRVHYLRPDGATIVGTTNDLGLWPFPLTNSYEGDYPGVGALLWTGLESDWTSGATCGGWSDHLQYGQVGRPDRTDGQALNHEAYSCTAAFRLICVEQ